MHYEAKIRRQLVDINTQLQRSITTKWTSLFPPTYKLDSHVVWVSAKLQKESIFAWSMYQRAAANVSRKEQNPHMDDSCPCCPSALPKSTIACSTALPSHMLGAMLKLFRTLLFRFASTMVDGMQVLLPWFRCDSQLIIHCLFEKIKNNFFFKR